MPTFTAGGALAVNFDEFDLEIFLTGDEKIATATTYAVEQEGERVTLTGVGFTYNSDGTVTGGTVTGISDIYLGQQLFELLGLSVPTSQLLPFVVADDVVGFVRVLLAGADTFTGSSEADVLRGFAGADLINPGAGADTVDGGDGDDTVNAGTGADSITDTSGSNYLRGDEGDDRIVGGSDFDDINGNMGNDTASGGLGEDWVVGGKDNDSLSGGAAYDLVYGNLGNDTCDGGDGNDVVRGGQQDDLIFGGLGDDYMSGDRDNDTVTGGAGADIFHTFGEAGVDRVMDFNLAQGDRVQVDPGTQYTLAQVGADTVISMTGGGQMVLVGVSLSSLSGTWIFGG
jgi:serralysin